MILVDTMIWADHIDHTDRTMLALLEEGQVACHPFVIGELALGNLRDRSLLRSLDRLPMAELAFHAEVLSFIGEHRLHGVGIGYVDAHLLASAQLSDNMQVWTRDRRLNATAERLGLAARPARLQ